MKKTIKEFSLKNIAKNKINNRRKLGKLYNNKEYIYKQGDIANEIYFVCEGNVALTMNDRVLSILDINEVFGLISLEDNELKTEQIRKTSAKAIGPTRIMRIDKDKLAMTLHKDPSLGWKMLTRTIKRLDMCEAMFANDFNVLHEMEKQKEDNKWNLINWLKSIRLKLKK